MKLKQVDGTYSILRYPPEQQIPDWALGSKFFCIARTDDELSIVCDTTSIDGDAQEREDDWKCIKVQGPLDFSLTGILSSIAGPLAEAKVSIFAISTFDTDYVMVKSDKISEAKNVLQKSGFDFD